jgi:hypothetical protein
MNDLLPWLLESDEPWTRYRALVDLLDRPESDSEVQLVRSEMLAHPGVRSLVADATGWPGYPLQRHNDARHPLYKLSTLADFGLRRDDPGIAKIAEAVMAHQSPQGAFQAVVSIPRAFGSSGEGQWAWMACDAPTLLYALLSMGMGSDKRLQAAVHHLVGLVQDNGWRCTVAPELGKFRGPGRKADPCPIANIYALKGLALVPKLLDSPATRLGADMLLGHWEHQRQKKYYLFGIGSDFRKLKYPFIWYDILHVVDVLSRFPFVHKDPRFLEMVATIEIQANASGYYTASSMYQAWKGWSFADKINPSPWLTFLVLRIQKRIHQLVTTI